MKISVKLDDAGIRRIWREAEQGELRAVIRANLRLEGQATVAEMQQRVTSGGKYARSSTSGGPRSSGLRVRSGALRNSLGAQVMEGDGGTVLRLGVIKESAAARYAAVQEYGTQGAKGRDGKGRGELPDIVPKKKTGFLTIPLEPALTPTGQLRFRAREAEERYDNVRFVRVHSVGGSGGDKTRLFLVGTRKKPTKKKRGVFDRLFKKKRKVSKAKRKPRTARQARKEERGPQEERLFLLVKSVAIPARSFIRPSVENAVDRINKTLPRRVAELLAGLKNGG